MCGDRPVVKRRAFTVVPQIADERQVNAKLENRGKMPLTKAAQVLYERRVYMDVLTLRSALQFR